MADYVAKFRSLTAGLIAGQESDRFLATAQRLVELTPAEIRTLNPVMPEGTVHPDSPTGEGILDWRKDPAP
jgi:2-methylcitrate dehydratase